MAHDGDRRLTLLRYKPPDRNPGLQTMDERIVQHCENHYALLRGDLAAVG